MPEKIKTRQSVGADAGQNPKNMMPQDSRTSNANQQITIKTHFQRSYPVTPEIVEFFYGEPEAFLFWMYAANLPPDFKLTKKQIRTEVLKCGEKKWKKAVDFLKKAGLLHLRYHRENRRIIGSEYFITDFHNMQKKTLEPSSIGPPSETHLLWASQKVPCNLLKKNILDAQMDFDPNPTLQKKPPSDESKVENKPPFDLPPCPPFKSHNPEDHKSKFLETFPGIFTFQTFGDDKKARRLNKVIHGFKNLDLELLNQQGAGVFLNICETDGRGRKTENIKKVRAVFADLDGAPLDPVLNYNPSMVVETSPGRFHAYWLCHDLPLSEFTPTQKAIAAKFNSDHTVCDITRVMRVPGFYHQKHEPFLSKIVFASHHVFKADDVRTMFPPIKRSPEYKPTGATIAHIARGVAKGGRNDGLVKLVAHLRKLGKPDNFIHDAAYQFGRECSPPMSLRDINVKIAWSSKIE